MFTTVIGTLLTGNLAIGVGAGVIAAMVAFATRVATVVEIENGSGIIGCTASCFRLVE